MNVLSSGITGRASRLTLVAVTLALGACSTLYRPVNQEVVVNTSARGERVEAACQMTNDKGTWNVVSPVIVGVTRSEKSLTVDCRDADGLRATQVFEAKPISASGLGSIGGISGYEYPERLSLELTRGGFGGRSVSVSSLPYAAIDDVKRVPNVSEAGRDGYRRFLAGASPRAFAVSDQGHWIRVNGSRGADRVALERCQSVGHNCQLYAVNDDVVWDRKSSGDLVASN